MRPIERAFTRDGRLIQHGTDYYLHAKLHDPKEVVELVGYHCSGPSWLDGRVTQYWRVRNPRGVEFLCESWQLSRMPLEELCRHLREGDPDDWHCFAREWAERRKGG
jgi:hypothetical protein